MLEGILILEEFIDEEGLSNPPPPIYRNKLRPGFFDSFLQKFKFFFSSYHNCLYLATNILIRFVLAKFNDFIWPQLAKNRPDGQIRERANAEFRREGGKQGQYEADDVFFHTLKTSVLGRRGRWRWECG